LTASAKAEFDRLNLDAQQLAAANDERPPPVRKIGRGLVSNIENALASITVLAGTVEAPAWWDGREWKPRNLIALDNGLLDLDAFFAGRADVLLPHTPRWFSPTCLPYPFDADADCPCWRAFLERNLERDRERIGILQEWFGLSLTPDTSRQRFMVFEGEGANGKSVVCAALEALLGSENCSHVPLEVFGERFQLTPTIGKLANIASEVGELDKAAEGFLKSFTSGEPMQFDRKHKPPIQALPTARLVLATNNRPRFSDRSGGLWRRMILMPFRVTIAENDPSRVFGMDKAAWWKSSGELPGIFNWALTGLDRLRRQDRFTQSQVCEQALAEYRTENNPARMFLSETCHELPEGQTPCAKLYHAYSEWCGANGYSPLASASFGKEVRRLFPKAERREIGPRGSRIHTYCGLAADGLGQIGP
jgi:putative DNA primase/helicase